MKLDGGNPEKLIAGTYGMNVPSACTIVIIAGISPQIFLNVH